MKTASIQICDQKAITRAYTMLSVEMGHVAAATAIYEQLLAHYGADNARWFLQRNGRAFPVLSAMAYEVGTQRIDKRIRGINELLASFLEHKTDIVCIGAETAWLDIATTTYTDKSFHIVPHSNDADLDRLLSNFGENVRIHDSVDLTRLYGTTSVIVTFAFNVTEHSFFTYPAAYRVCGLDTRQAFSELIALDLIDSPLRFHPPDLVEMDTDEMTCVLSRALESTRRSRVWTLAAF